VACCAQAGSLEARRQVDVCGKRVRGCVQVGSFAGVWSDERGYERQSLGCGCGWMACELSMACACEYGWGRLARQRPLLCVVFSAAECARATWLASCHGSRGRARVRGSLCGRYVGRLRSGSAGIHLSVRTAERLCRTKTYL
jgi:hypothetical protein